MEVESLLSEVASVKEFDQWLTRVADGVMSPKFTKSDEVDNCLNLEFSEIIDMPYDKCYAYSILLLDYAAFLQTKTERLKSLKCYAESTIDRYLAANWSNFYAGEYCPQNIKRQAIIKTSEMATLLEKCRVRLGSVVAENEQLCQDLRRRSNLFSDYARKKQ